MVCFETYPYGFGYYCGGFGALRTYPYATCSSYGLGYWGYPILSYPLAFPSFGTSLVAAPPAAAAAEEKKSEAAPAAAPAAAAAAAPAPSPVAAEEKKE